MKKSRCRSPQRSKPRLLYRKPPPLGANLRRMRKSERRGANTASEAPLHSPGTCRSSEHPRYVAAQSPHGARRVHARIKTIIDLLLLHPYLGRRTSEPTIRRLAATPYPYLIFYEISETEITIHALR